MKNNFESDGYTGHLIEREVFSEIDKDKYLEESRKDSRLCRELEGKRFLNFRQYIEDSYCDFKRSLDMAKRCQPKGYDPAAPNLPYPFATDLHRTIGMLLNKEGVKFNSLKLFTAVSSHFDRKHKTDAFVEISRTDERGRKKNIIVRLDISKNTDKVEVGPDGLPVDQAAEPDRVVFLFPSEGLDPKDPNDKDKYEAIYNDVVASVFGKVSLNIASDYDNAMVFYDPTKEEKKHGGK